MPQPRDARRRLKQVPVLGASLEWLWRALTGRKSLAFDLKRDRRVPRDATLVKIGANDGFTDDPFAELLESRPGMRCVFVEPVPHLLDRARAHWGDAPRFTYLQAAVNDGRDATFYYVDPQARRDHPDVPYEPDLLGSFDRNHILKHPGCDRFEPYIRELPVRGLSLDQVFQESGVSRPDILHVDAEGWDWKILSQLDLTRHRPLYLVFEFIHLSPAEAREARDRLSDGYTLETYGTDWVWRRKPE